MKKLETFATSFSPRGRLSPRNVGDGEGQDPPDDPPGGGGGGGRGGGDEPPRGGGGIIEPSSGAVHHSAGVRRRRELDQSKITFENNNVSTSSSDSDIKVIKVITTILELGKENLRMRPWSSQLRDIGSSVEATGYWDQPKYRS